MELELRNFDKFKMVAIVLNPCKPPYVIHNHGDNWDKDLINELLSGYMVYRPVKKDILVVDRPSVIVLDGKKGIGVFSGGRLTEKIRGGILKISLLNALINSRLYGNGYKKLVMNFREFNMGLAKVLIERFKPVIFKTSSIELLDEFIDHIGYELVIQDNSSKELRLISYLEKKYDIKIPHKSNKHGGFIINTGSRSIELGLNLYDYRLDGSIFLERDVAIEYPGVYFDVDNRAIQVKMSILLE